MIYVGVDLAGAINNTRILVYRQNALKALMDSNGKVDNFKIFNKAKDYF